MPLPKIADCYKPIPQPKITGRLMQFSSAVDNVKNKTWSLDEFKNFIDSLLKTMVEKGREIRTLEIPPEVYHEFEEELHIGYKGIDLFEQGMVELSYYIQDQNEEHLDRGLQLLEEGNDTINDALRINHETQERLEELYNSEGGLPPI